MTVKSRLDRLETLTGAGGPVYSWPDLVDIRGLSEQEAAAAIAAIERRQQAEDKRFESANIVIISTCTKNLSTEV